jgi:hypothetical protein
MATLMMFMYTYGLSMDACVAWSTAQHAAAAACFGAAAAATYPLARQKLKNTLLGVAAVALRNTGWQTPSPQDVSGQQAGMQGFAMRRTRYKVDYVDDGTYFDYSFELAHGHDRGDGLNQYEFQLAYCLVMSLLPFAVINFCDDRGRHCAFSQLKNWSTAEFLIRAQLFTCVAAIVMMDVMVVPPWTTGAGRYTDRPLFFVNSFSVGQGQTIEGMVAYLPKSNDPIKIRAALKVMAQVYVRGGLAPEGMTVYQVYKTMVRLSGFGAADHAVKNITLASSASQGICECSTQLKIGGGKIVTIITGGDGGAGEVEVKIHPASAKKICDLWNLPGARAAADAKALTQFAAEFYTPRRAPWEGGVEIITKDDDDEEEISGPADVTDTATPSSEEELTPKLLETVFYAATLYAVALKSGEVEKAVTAVGECVDELVGEDASATLRLFEELLRARSRGRFGGPADLSKIWDKVERPSWDPASKGFLERAMQLRKGMEMTTRDVPKLYDDDRKLIYDPSSSMGFDELLAQYSKDESTAKARTKLQRCQKNAGSLEAMYEAPEPRLKRRRS